MKFQLKTLQSIRVFYLVLLYFGRKCNYFGLANIIINETSAIKLIFVLKMGKSKILDFPILRAIIKSRDFVMTLHINYTLLYVTL